MSVCKEVEGWETDLIEEKLLSESDRCLLSWVDIPPDCVHSLFALSVPPPPLKMGGGGRIDCSKPKGQSVNSETSMVVHKIKYLSVDNVIDDLEPGNFMASRSHQGLKWNFGEGDNLTYMVDNRLYMGLSSSPYIFT